MVFCNNIIVQVLAYVAPVTILILIDGFLQSEEDINSIRYRKCHNPYFNRWFSAIPTFLRNSEIFKYHNPYFNRWFSAIKYV